MEREIRLPVSWIYTLCEIGSGLLWLSAMICLSGCDQFFFFLDTSKRKYFWKSKWTNEFCRFSFFSCYRYSIIIEQYFKLLKNCIIIVWQEYVMFIGSYTTIFSKFFAKSVTTAFTIVLRHSRKFVSDKLSAYQLLATND